MASVQFQIHTDKENAVTTGHKASAVSFQGGKTFQTGSLQSHKTPRRALGSVNEVHRVGGKALASQGVKKNIAGSVSGNALKPKKVAVDKDAKLKQQQTDKENAVKQGKQKEHIGTSHLPLQSEQQQQQPTSYCLPDIEYMPPPSPVEDDDEDILPLKDRASTYVHKLLNWRPQCLFGAAPESEDEEDAEKERQRIMEELDNLPLPVEDDLFPEANLHLSCEQLDLDSIELPTMDDVSLPYIDDDLNSSAEARLSTLDDSVGLEQQLGTLQIMDQSLSPCSQH